MQVYRRVPLALEDAVYKELDSLENQGIIEKVEGVSRWVSPMVIVPKKDG